MYHAQTVLRFTEWCDVTGLDLGDRYLIGNPFFHMAGNAAGEVEKANLQMLAAAQKNVAGFHS